MGMKAKRSIVIAALLLLALQAAVYAQYRECYVYDMQGVFMGTMASPAPFSDSRIMALGDKEITINSGQVGTLPYDLYHVTSQRYDSDIPEPPAITDFGFEDITNYAIPDEQWSAAAVACGDINGDGLIDLIFSIADVSTTNPSDFRPQIWMQLENNDFANLTELWIRSTGCPSRDIELFDADNDGDLDLFLSGYCNPPDYYWPAVLLINVNNLYFEDDSAARLPAVEHQYDYVYRVEAADIDNDNDSDLIINIFSITSPGFHHIYPEIWLNDGNGHYSRDTNGRLPANDDYGYFDFSVGNIDNDDWMDIAFSNIEIIILDNYGNPIDTLFGNNAVYHNSGDGYFEDESAARMPEPEDENTRELVFADCDNDGDNDFLEVGFEFGEYQNQVRLLLNDGSGHYEVATSALPDSLTGWFNKTIVDDFNNDQYPEIFLINVSPGESNYDKLLLNDGETQFQDRSDLLPRRLDFSVSCAAFDYQQDDDSDIFIANAGESLFVTGQNVFYKNILFDIAGINDEPGNLPANTQLLTNYPNPFNNSTLISFYIEKPGPIELNIYNLMGELVESARISTQPGYCEYLWQADDQSSGVYFCKIKSDYGESSHKMILLK